MRSGSIQLATGILLMDLHIRLVHGFLPSSHRKSEWRLSLARHHEAASAAPLPVLSMDTSSSTSNRKPPPKLSPPKPRRRRRKEDWQGKGIPETVPKLSDLLKDTCHDDFIVAVDTSPPETQTAPRPHRPSPHLPKRRRPSAPQSTTPEEVSEPWRANFVVSSRTQKRIKAAAGLHETRRNGSPVKRATAILKALLDTPPEECNEVNVVCALTLSAKAMTTSSVSRDEFRRLLMKTFDMLMQLVSEERLNGRQLCNSVWAIAKHYNLDNSILPAPPEATAVVSDEMVGVTEAWILQDSDDTAEKRVKETVELIALQITRLLQDDNQRTTNRKIKIGEICMATWAYGVLRPRQRPPGWSVPPQIGHVPHRSRLPRQNNVEIVTFSTWAYGEKNDSMDTPEDAIDRLFDAVGGALTKEEIFPGERTPSPFLESCTWSEMANVAWAYAHHGYSRSRQAQRALKGLAGEAGRRLALTGEDGRAPRVLPRDIAQLVWSIGTLQSDNFHLGDDLVHLIGAVADHYGLYDDGRIEGYSSDRPLQHWSCADLVQLAISMAHGRVDHPPLLRALYGEAYTRLMTNSDEQFGNHDRRHSFYSWEVSVLLWAQARLYLREPEGTVFEKFAAEAPSWIRKWLGSKATLEETGIGPQEQANLAWSLTVLEQYTSNDAEHVLQRIFHEASSSSEIRHCIQLEHAHQLWQALCLLEDVCPTAVSRVPRWFRDYLEDKWATEKARRKRSSARHKSLSQTLDLMGVAHYNEHDEDIDVAIVLRDESSWTHEASHRDHIGAKRKVAVEFDGPNHFTRERWDVTGKRIPPRTLGHTVLKYRLLKKQGWAVVRVPYYEFDKIPFWASMERQRYLQRLLKTHQSISFSKVDISAHTPHVPNRSSRFD